VESNQNVETRRKSVEPRNNKSECSGVASMEQMEQLLPPERQGPLM